MTRLTRRQFLGTTAAGALAAPHIWVRSASAQQKQLSILCWSHFVPAYDKWFDQLGQEWAAKNNVKVTIDHIPHLNLAAKIAAEIATQSGHDIVQLAGSGTEKFAPALHRRAGPAPTSSARSTAGGRRSPRTIPR